MQGRIALVGWVSGVILLVSVQFALAQESVNQETNPPFLKWYQIQTPGFRILYPKGFDAQAQRMANTLQTIYLPESRTMGAQPKPISIILQNQSAMSNGFVTLAPRRSEFYPMPTQNYNFAGNNDWLNMLASHEYRHVVQFQRSITGFNRFVYFVFGQQATAGLIFAAAPQWFWEGDAVATETAFTRSGRGRIPNFDLVFRTNLQEGRIFDYNKQYLRSYKNNISNHYVIGYHMISYLRRKTGDPFIWEKIAGRAWSHSFVPFTFSNAVKKETGKFLPAFYKEMAADLVKQWKEDADGLTYTSFERVSPRTNTVYTDYLYPQILEDGRVIAQKSGIGDIERLVSVTPGGENKIFVQGQMNATGMQSASGHRIVWNEYRFDPRWLVRTYTSVIGYDFKTKTAKVFSSKARYAAAALSPDGNKVVTVETGTDYQTRLVILDYNSGDVIKALPNEANDFLSMPRWSDDGKTIIYLRLGKAGKTITGINYESGIATDFLPVSNENIGNPVPAGKYILYNSPYSGIDNIYAIDTESGRRFQVTSSRYGSYNPALSRDGSTIYYNEQTRDGMDVVRAPLSPASWKPLEEVKIIAGLYGDLVKQENRSGLLDSIPSTNYPTRRYHRASGMINPHSWGPYFVNNNLTQAQLGIYSQDILSTTSINAGYLYDINEKTGAFQAGVSYQGFYPIIDAAVQTGTREETHTLGDQSVRFNWKETGTSLGLRVPLLLTHSKYLAQFEISDAVSATNVSGFQNTVSENGEVISKGTGRDVVIPVINKSYVFTDQLSNGLMLSNAFTVSYTHVLKQSRKDFQPKFGQVLAYENYNALQGSDFTGKLWAVRGLLYFPGLFKHHSLFFRGGYQYTPPNSDFNAYTFRNRVFKPRGYSYPNDNTFYSVSTNYQLPVWYPDLAVGPLLNVQRVKLNMFYDYGHSEGKTYYYDLTMAPPQVYYSSQKTNYQSGGMELTFDVNVLRLLQQIEIGFRVTRVNPTMNLGQAWTYDFIIGNIPF